MDFRSLPEEMQALKQWAIAGGDGAPLITTPSGLKNVSIHSVEQLMTFEEASAFANENNMFIGFVLTKDDPFSCIDMDVCDEASQIRKGKPVDKTKWTTKEEFKRYQSIVNAFDSYTERSRSGKGLHLWALGNIGLGCRRDGVEVYSQERFIICTGDVYVNKPLKENQNFFNLLVKEMRKIEKPVEELVEISAELEDSEVFEIASSADNGVKFDALCQGQWEELNYPSQSEADLSLMSILCFYSKSNEQCRRLFRYSALGKRDKATQDDKYLDKTLRLIRSRQKAEDLQAIDGEKLAKELIKELSERTGSKAIESAHNASGTELPNVDGLSWPPGLAGAIAGFIYQSAPRPVKEVAIVASLGLLAGICGKAWHLNQTGLNMYIILVARSAVGKEAMHSGLGLILAKLRESTPAASKFVDFSDFVSGPALVKACAANNSFVNVAGEWGKKLRRLSMDEVGDGPMSQLRTVMTNLYQKSGPASIVGGLTYSKAADNVASVNGVAYSMIGETTPGTLYDSLTETMMEDGFLSRFNIVEYSGERPPANENPIIELPNDLAEALSGVCVHALTLLQRFQSCKVLMDEESTKFFKRFDKECDAEINSTDVESRRQMWNRAHLKAIKLAALLAVADNWIAPVVNMSHAKWALDLIRRDISLISKKLSGGEIGFDDDSRRRKIVKVFENYLTAEEIPDSYGISGTMHKMGILPRKYLQVMTSKVSCFTKFRGGATLGLELALKSLIEDGAIYEIPPLKVRTDYNFSGKCYAIADPTIFRTYKSY